jgi:hypothetical protein
MKIRIFKKNIKLALPCTLTKPCQNNAACGDNNLGGYTCTCITGYNGVNCEYGKIFFEFMK